MPSNLSHFICAIAAVFRLWVSYFFQITFLNQIVLLKFWNLYCFLKIYSILSTRFLPILKVCLEKIQKIHLQIMFWNLKALKILVFWRKLKNEPILWKLSFEYWNFKIISDSFPTDK